MLLPCLNYIKHVFLTRFLSELSDRPYYKAGTKGKEEEEWRRAPEGKYTSSTALVFDSSPGIVQILSKIIEVILT